MAYQSWSVVFGEQPSASKWNILGTNDAHFYSLLGDTANLVVQVASTSFTAVATGTTVIPFDDTIPQNTEGTEFMTQAITPKSASNTLQIFIQASVSSTGPQQVIGALFQDSTSNALAATSDRPSAALAMASQHLQHKMTAGTTSATTFKYRAGPDGGAATVTFNGSSGGRIFGGITKSTFTILEVKA